MPPKVNYYNYNYQIDILSNLISDQEASVTKPLTFLIIIFNEYNVLITN